MAFISAAVFGHAMWSFLPSGQESVVRVEVADVIVVTVSVDGAAVLEVEVEVEEEEEGGVSNCGFRTISSLCSQKSPTYPSVH